MSIQSLKRARHRQFCKVAEVYQSNDESTFQLKRALYDKEK